jgi:deoxyribodipyrimidine photolyase
MSNCLIIIDHSFRTNSLIFHKALSAHDKVCVLHVSSYYINDKFKNYYKNSNNGFYYKILDDFSKQLLEKYSLKLRVLKSKSAEDIIEDFCLKEKVEKVFYDKPLFSEKLLFKKIKVEEIDSDSYIDSCKKMTAKSRWIFWAKNRLANSEVFCDYRELKDFGNIGDIHITNDSNAKEIRNEVCNAYSRFKNKLTLYHESRNEREGSTKLSKFLHHGLIDARVITHIILSLTDDFIEKDHPTIPILRQLAFREISIEKCRQKEIGLLDSAKEISEKILDKKSLDNLFNNEFDSVFTKEQFMNGNTNNQLLNREIKLCIENRWMPNRLRMWLSGECYWGIGGGIKTLETLIEFFNKYSEDGQSPNNIISCTECMRMSYGKVMKYNEKRTFKLLADD